MLESMHDKHLNLFYAYSQGGCESAEDEKQLENNLTRAFLITLSRLGEDKQREFIEKLLDRKITKNDDAFNYDLQKLKPEEKEKALRRDKKRILLIISRYKDSLDKKPFFSKAIENEVQLLEEEGALRDEEEESQIKKWIKSHFEHWRLKGKLAGNERTFGKITLSEDNIENYGQLVLGNVPDGWIYNAEFAILIEAKIGNAGAGPHQLFRHLTGKDGFSISAPDVLNGERYSIVSTAWEEISTWLEEIDRHNEIVREFKEYLIMTGEKLDLGFILKESGQERIDILREQFPLFLDKLDDKVKVGNLNIDGLERGRRPLSTVDSLMWDYYGLKKKEGTKAEQDPHYTIIFFSDKSAIHLSSKKESQMKRLLGDEGFRDFLKGIINRRDRVELGRYCLSMVNYRIIDHKQGQQRGESFDTFVFRVGLSELESGNDILSIVEAMKGLTHFAKQVDFGIEILYPNVEKIKDTDEGTMRLKNKKLFDNHDDLLKLYYDFMDATKQFFQLMAEK